MKLHGKLFKEIHLKLYVEEAVEHYRKALEIENVTHRIKIVVNDKDDKVCVEMWYNDVLDIKHVFSSFSMFVDGYILGAIRKK